MCENFIITLGIGAEIVAIFAQRTEYKDYPLYPGVMSVAWYLAIISYILMRVFSFSKDACFGLAFCYFA
jgi:hypothetical protein